MEQEQDHRALRVTARHRAHRPSAFPLRKGRRRPGMAYSGPARIHLHGLRAGLRRERRPDRGPVRRPERRRRNQRGRPHHVPQPRPESDHGLEQHLHGKTGISESLSRANLGNYVYNQPKQANTRVYDTTGAQYMLSNLMADTFLFYNSSSAERLPALELLCGERKLPPLRQHHPGIHHSRLPLRRRLRSAHIRSRPESLRDNKVHRSRPRGIQRRAGFALPSPHHNHTSASYSHSNPGLTEEKHENIQ